MRSWMLWALRSGRTPCTPTSWTAAAVSVSALPGRWILDPKLVVCDEPVSALDVSIQAQILNLMMELQKERNLTYLFITHNLSVVKHISDDITVMYLGQMVEKAGSSEIFAHQYHPYTKALISAIPLPKYNAPDNQIILKGEITSPINVTKSCRFAPRCIYAKPECFNQEPALEEVEPGHFVKWSFRAGDQRSVRTVPAIGMKES